MRMRLQTLKTTMPLKSIKTRTTRLPLPSLKLLEVALRPPLAPSRLGMPPLPRLVERGERRRRSVGSLFYIRSIPSEGL